MNVIGINRVSPNHNDYYGVVQLSYDEIIVIANALHKYNKQTESEYMKKISLPIKDKWGDFRDMVCYGGIFERQNAEE